MLLVINNTVDVRDSYSSRGSYSLTKQPVVCYAFGSVSGALIPGIVTGSALSSLAVATLKASSVVLGGRGGIRGIVLPLQCADSSAVFVLQCSPMHG